MVSSETSVNTGYDPLERPPTEGNLPTVPGLTIGQYALSLQLNNTTCFNALHSLIKYLKFLFNSKLLVQNILKISTKPRIERNEFDQFLIALYIVNKFLRIVKYFFLI